MYSRIFPPYHIICITIGARISLSCTHLHTCQGSRLPSERVDNYCNFSVSDARMQRSETICVCAYFTYVHVVLFSLNRRLTNCIIMGFFGRVSCKIVLAVHLSSMAMNGALWRFLFADVHIESDEAYNCPSNWPLRVVAYSLFQIC